MVTRPRLIRRGSGLPGDRAGDQGVSLGAAKAFTARPVPQTGKPLSASDRWASEQFEELERVLRELRAEVDAVAARVDEDSWDGA